MKTLLMKKLIFFTNLHLKKQKMYQHQGDVDRGQPVQLGKQPSDEVGQHQVKPAKVSQHSHDRYVWREKETISAGQKIGVSVKQRKAQEDIGQVSYQVNLSQEATPPEQMTDQEDYLVWITVHSWDNVCLSHRSSI